MLKSENILDYEHYKSKKLINEKNNCNDINKNKKNKKKEENKVEYPKKYTEIDKGVPIGVTEVEINMALKNKNLLANLKNNFPINNNHAKYEFIKNYSRIKPNKNNGFIQRMQFDSFKRRSQEEKLNEIIKTSKQKINELSEKDKVFERLLSNYKKKFCSKFEKEIENEKNMTEIFPKNNKKYNEKEWNDIYNKRFKDFEYYKMKKMEIQRTKEKIQKMINEEEQINMCKVKKIPLQKIAINTIRLYEDVKKKIFKNRHNKKLIRSKNNKLYLTTVDKPNNENSLNYYMNLRKYNTNNSYLIPKSNRETNKLIKYAHFKNTKILKNLNGNKGYNNNKMKKDNIVDKYIYDYCIKKYYN